MRRIARLLLLLVVLPAAVLFASEKEITVAVSLQPYATLLKMLGGARVNVVTLLPPGADPHNYEPKPAVIKAFSLAEAYFTDGSGLDKAWLPRFLGANKNVKVIDISRNIKWMKAEHDDHHHLHHDDESELDPHIWTSPMRLQLLALNIYESFKALDPDHIAYYTNRFMSTQEILRRADRKIVGAIVGLPLNRRSFIVFHPSYGYLANDYNLTQYSIEVNGKEPKPKDLAKLIQVGRKNDVKTVFVQPQFSKRAAETIAKELGAVVVETDPLAADFLANIQTFVDALKAAGEK
ncbi:zinc ABC transporter substrate-binding protein [uncultured Fibrobacter sp.]|uniref:metal ABC transporter solute-binding protein, Zn/Mn family n=1 Tax=uncultured Fibrobacter sp. TaxID=261512 RepID=UPI0025CFA44B|nr:zinc ABC transporter substrate-binding protein [uncultured Fibrobacter sp.]